MVLLQMTPLIVEALRKTNEPQPADSQGPGGSKTVHDEPSLKDPLVGNPISHAQIMHLWRVIKASEEPAYSLESLLNGSAVYIPPPPPKPEPSAEYKALMARLRKEEEARQYSRMVSPPRPETFDSRFPSAASFAAANQPHSREDLGEDRVTLDEVHRQVTLIINILASIVGVAGTLWYLARWWSTPARLLLALGSSFLVAMAEWAVYSGYVWRMSEGQKQEDRKVETRKVLQTWVVGKEDKSGMEVIPPEGKPGESRGVRQRITSHGKARGPSAAS